MSRLSIPTLSPEEYLSSVNIPVVKYSNTLHSDHTLKQPLSKEKKKKPYLFDLPDLQIKKIKTMTCQLSESTRVKSSPLVSDAIQIQSSESVCKQQRRIKKKVVTIPLDNFVQVVEIESFKQFNFIEEVKAKEYDIYTKKCCLIF